jgi:IclR family transcriptional regulator, KDG regulon repressor
MQELSLKDGEHVEQNLEHKSQGQDLSTYNVPAVDRAARILLLLVAESREMSLAEIASATGFHKSSVHKILVTLLHHGFLERDNITKRYSLGIALVRCGQSVLNNLHINHNHSAKSVLKELADFSGETANLAILHGNKTVIVDVMESQVELRVSPPVGTMDPVATKSNGKAILAWMPELEVDEILRVEGLHGMTRNSITKVLQYRSELAAVREKGYATDCEEFKEGINAVSAPVFNSERRVIGTLNIVGPAFRMTQEKMEVYGRKCAEAATRISPLIR